nr:twin-arginine translocation signal domain-containing protein [Haliscomenobacter sp.]
MDRRSFIQQAGLAGAAVLTPPYLIPSRPAKYKTVLIGSCWWGLNILREAIRSGQVTVAALCDVDENQLNLHQNRAPRHRDQRHARPLACPHRHRSHAKRGARLFGKTHLPYGQRRLRH